MTEPYPQPPPRPLHQEGTERGRVPARPLARSRADRTRVRSPPEEAAAPARPASPELAMSDEELQACVKDTKRFRQDAAVHAAGGAVAR